MSQFSPLSKDNFRNTIDVYLSNWRWILLSLIAALIVAFLYLRYSTYQYQSSASIKLKEDNNSKLPEISSLQDYGFFADNSSNVLDEIEIIKSRTIISKVVDELNLNIKYFVTGRVKENEVYLKPPINLNFFATDSVIKKIDTTLFLSIINQDRFELSNTDNKNLFGNVKGNGTEYAFGDRIKTGFGDLIITPNIGNYGMSDGSQIKIAIKPHEEVVEDYKKKILIKNNVQSNVLTLTLNENIRIKAQLILDKLIEKYNEDAVQDKEQIVKVTSDFINNRLEIVSNELEQVDLTAEALKKDNRLSDIASQSSIFLQSEKENEAKLITASNQLQLIDYMDGYMNSNDSDSDLLPANIGIADNSVAETTKRYNDLVLQRDRILENSSDKNPVVVNLNNQIRAIKNNLNQSLNNLRSSTQITLNSLNREDARIRSQIFATPKKERQFRDISRQQSIKESLYLYLLEKREETAITLGMSSPNAKIVESAYTSITPISPKKNLVYLAALVLGLFLPIAFIYFMELLDTKVHTKDDVSQFVKAPFIGDIPSSSVKKSRRIISKVDYSPKAEAFRMVRTNLDFMLKSKDDETAKIIFVTSTMAQEGKSHTATNLATSWSYSEKKVLLIDTDIRVPKIAEYIGVKNKKGLTDFIGDPKLTIDDILVHVKDNNYLDAIPSGTIPPNPAELLMSDRVKLLIEKVKTKYDYIIVDTAAVGLVTDTLLISQFADLFVYVVSAEKLDKRQLHVAQTMYNERRLPNMTILLNGTSKKNGYGYGYGYGNNPKKKWYQFS
ncbi:MAG: polysaccharide biosynthesis tyrosine autokinase [Flavobacteriaceae bacterium]|nr:polysaccharide biosynthesis tyrosine autokinase [Flavobacteriaceae bacterium]